MEEKNLYGHKTGGFAFLGLVLAIILVGTGGFLVYQKYQDDVKLEQESTNNNEDQNQGEQENDPEEVDVVQEVLVGSSEYEQLLNLYQNVQPNYYNIGNNFYYHDVDQLLVRDMDPSLKLYLAATNVMDYYLIDGYRNNKGDYRVPEAILEESYHRLFGNGDNYQFVEVNGNENCPKLFKTDQSVNESLTDEVYFATQCGDTGLPTIYQEVIKIESSTSKNEVYVYEVVGFPKYLGQTGANGGDLADIYADSNRSTLVVSGVETDYRDSSFLNAFKDKLPVYKYTFQSEDGNYYFYSVEEVK